MTRPSASLVASFFLALIVCACDEPPKAPEPSVNIDQEQKELRQKVEEVQAKVNQRIDQIDDDLPEGDAGPAKDVSPAEH